MLLRVILALSLIGSLASANTEAVTMPVSINQKNSEIHQVLVSEGSSDEYKLSKEKLLSDIAQLKLKAPQSLLEYNSDVISLGELKVLGFYVFFNEEKVEIEISLPLDKNQIEDLELNKKSVYVKEGEAIEQAPVSGYLNTSATAGFRRDRYTVGYGDPLSARFDGVVNLLGYVLEGRGTSTEHMPFQREDIRLTKEIDVLGGIRVSAGDIYYPLKGFQTFRKAGGLSVYTVTEQRQGYLSSKSSDRTLEIRQPSMLTFFVNERMVTTKRVVPGVYNITDIPLATGVNHVRVLIEAEGSGEKENIIFDDFLSSNGIKQGQTEFAFAIGDKSFDNLNSREYRPDDKLLIYSLRYDFSNKHSTTHYFQGDKKTQLLGLAQSYHLKGGYIEGDLGLSNTDGKNGTAFKFGYYKTSPNESYLFEGDRYSVNLERKFSSFSNIDTEASRGATTVSASYVLPRFKLFTMSFGANVSKQDWMSELSQSMSASLGRNFGEYAVSTSLTRQDSEFTESEILAAVNINWSPNERSYYTSFSKSTRGSNDVRISMNAVTEHDIKASVSTSNEPGSRSMQAQITGVTNRSEMTFSGSRYEGVSSGGSFNEHFFFNTRFALAFANSKFAIGKPISDSFFITDSQVAERKYKIESFGRYAETGPMGEALLGFQSYKSTTARVSSGDIYGNEFNNSGVFNVEKSYRAGYLLRITEKISPTVISFKIENLDEIANKIGKLTNPVTNESLDFFVSSDGEVFIEGIEAGVYNFEIGSFKGQVTLDQAGGRKVFGTQK